jgi:outer membrane protein OmpA-like peptidoglycan-associated protein
LLGEHADQVTDTVARSSLVSRSTSSSVVRALLPIAAGVLGREVASNKLDANGLAGLLEAQKRHLAGHPMLGGIATETESAVGVRDVGVYPTAAPRRATAQPEPHKRSMWPLLLLGLLLLAAFLLLLRWQTPTTPRTSKPEIPSVEEPAGQTTMTGAEIAKPGGEDLAAHFSGKGELPDRFALPGVNFEFGTTTLTEGGEATIDALAAQMKAHPSSRLRLEGHTDSTGDQDVNAPLSYQRAGVVKNMLVERGIGANRIETKGRLANDPVAPNDTRAGRAQNRRIDAVILVR